MRWAVLIFRSQDFKWLSFSSLYFGDSEHEQHNGEKKVLKNKVRFTEVCHIAFFYQAYFLEIKTHLF
jgi:hypothetical protein